MCFGVFDANRSFSAYICAKYLLWPFAPSLLSAFKLNLHNTSLFICIMENQRFFSINHRSVVIFLRVTKMQVKFGATHVKQLIWLKPSFITSFFKLQQAVCGVPRGWCGGKEAFVRNHTTHPPQPKPGFNLCHGADRDIASRLEEGYRPIKKLSVFLCLKLYLAGRRLCLYLLSL